MAMPDSDAQAGKWLQINPPVFLTSAVLIVGFALVGALLPEEVGAVFGHVQRYIVETFGWFYMIAVAAFLVFIVVLAFTPHGRVKLGPDDSTPDYTYLSWFAMLFSAGMGIGLMFFSVAEPIMHFTAPPVGDGGTVAAAREAMEITFFHWGVHAWAIYAVVGLSLAYFTFRHNLPLTIRSSLYPLIGERIHGPIGHAVDIFAVLGTLFGVATSLGLGVMQVNAGLEYLFGVPVSTPVQIVLIGVITFIATLSVAAGLDAGIRRLSVLNLYLAVALLTFMVVAGPTVFLLTSLVQNVGAYLNGLVDKTFQLYAYEKTGWIGGWTLFYWGWWIAWSPFVGMFIARVSRGRTIREFILGVLLVPAGFTFMWLSFFGGTALNMELGESPGALSAIVAENVPVALFALLEELPLSAITSVLATVLVVTFFVTSSDSGSLVIDTITAGGEKPSPVWQRIFWAVISGVIAAILLLAGGLTALQTASIASALPFSIVMLVICYALWKGLAMESAAQVDHQPPPPVPVMGNLAGWRTRLNALLRHPSHQELARFLRDTAGPALETVATEIRTRGLEAEVETSPERVALTATRDGEADFLYAVVLKGYRATNIGFPELALREREPRLSYRAEVYLLEGSAFYDIMGYTREQVIADLLSQYEKHMHFLHVASHGNG